MADEHARDEVDVILERAARAAAARGQVESADLFLALLDSHRSGIEAALVRAGLDTAALRDYLTKELDALPRSSSGDTIGVTRTVARAVAAARARARRHDRAGASIQDLVEGFVEAGGGSIGQLLTALGLSLDQALGVRRHTSTASERLDSPFDDSGVLLPDCLAPSAASALQAAGIAAGILARDRVTVIPSAMLLLGFAAAGSTALRAALDEQGEPGQAAALHLLADEQPRVPLVIALRREHFTPRTADVLNRAFVSERAAGLDQADDAAILYELLREEESSAAALLEALDIDPVRLAAALGVRRRRPAEEQPGEGAEPAPDGQDRPPKDGCVGAEVFISHSMDEDGLLALELADHLEAARVKVWVAQRCMVGGQKFNSEVPQAIQACKAVVVLLSRATLTSDHVEAEIAMAFDSKKHIIPVVLEDVELPPQFKYWLWLPHRIRMNGRSLRQTLPEVLQALVHVGVDCDLPTDHQRPP